MSKPLTKSDILDIILVIFGLICTFQGVYVVTFDFLNRVILQSQSTWIYKSPWATGLYALLLFVLAYVSIFQRKKIIPVITRHQPLADNSNETDNIPCFLTSSFWVQMFGLYQFVKNIFNIAQYFVYTLSTNMDGFANSLKWLPYISHSVLLIVAGIIIIKSRQIGAYLDKLRGAPNRHPTGRS